jgi:hypothetical protein
MEGHASAVPPAIPVITTQRLGHYYIGLLQFALLLLKNHSLFSQNRYAHSQAAILRGTFHRFFRGRDAMQWNEESCR